jgi:hypothetical protein
VADSEDLNPIAVDPIADEIRGDVRKLPTTAPYLAAAARHFRQRCSGALKPAGQMLRCERLELAHIGRDGVKFSQSALCPNYLNQALGAGLKWGVPHVSSQVATSL